MSPSSPEREAAHARLESLADPYLAHPDVAWGRMFGGVGLAVRSKIFAVATHDGRLMVKVPEARAVELADAGDAEPMVMRGREMREWVVADLSAPDAVWTRLLDDAYAYLEQITPR